MSDGWCPFARQHRGLAAGPFGYPAGTQGQNWPLAFVNHRMAGYKRTLDDDDWRHRNWVGVHFGIGRDGSVDQYTSILDASWGNGVAGSVTRYDRANARLRALEDFGAWAPVPYAGTTAYALVARGVNVINAHTISIEHEDEGVDQPWTPAMVEADIRVKRWCLEELAAAGRPMEMGPDMLVGHFQIDAVNRANCPGDNWPRDVILRALMEEEPMTKEDRELVGNVLNYAIDVNTRLGIVTEALIDHVQQTGPPASTIDLSQLRADIAELHERMDAAAKALAP